jgi:membrane-bound lytic murein transglycosylase A
MADLTTTNLDFDQLIGWADDDHAAALTVFRNTSGELPGQDWAKIGALVNTTASARTFFERYFQPTLCQDGRPMLFTGYYEPELRGALYPDSTYRYPIYALPPDLPQDQPWLTRQQIEQSGVLLRKGLEIAWLADPADVFFLQVQGSGQIKLPDSRVIRVGFAGKNGQPYSSIGAELVARGEFAANKVTADAIRVWIRTNPEKGQELLWTNASFVFFRELSELPSDHGPLGAMNRSVTPLRSIAVDPSIVPLGAPVWIEKAGKSPMNRLMMAQDTGSAIKGAQRADIFYGTGSKAGLAAGKVRDAGRMVVLIPRHMASSHR